MKQNFCFCFHCIDSCTRSEDSSDSAPVSSAASVNQALVCHQQLFFVADLDNGDEDEDMVGVAELQNAETELQNNRVKEKEV